MKKMKKVHTTWRVLHDESDHLRIASVGPAQSIMLDLKQLND
jgi:hypothetical protein